MFTLGLGTGSFINANEQDLKKPLTFLEYAIEQGIQYIDTAEDYQEGLAEEIIGKAISGKRQQVFVGSKFSPKHHAKKAVEQACRASCQRLKVDFLDLYSMHWPNPSIPLKETVEGMRAVVQQGLAKHIGFCNVNLSLLQLAQELLQDIPIHSVQIEYNSLEQTIEYSGVRQYCEDNNIAIIAYSPLDRGRLGQFKASQQQTLTTLCQRYGLSLPQLIIAWLVNFKEFCPLIRTRDQQHLLDNLRASQTQIAAEDLIQLGKIFSSDIILINTEEIRVAQEGDHHNEAYFTLQEALENKYNFSPSPLELAQAMDPRELIKPVRLKRLAEPEGCIQYELIAGRVRYWAWMIANNKQHSKIPAYFA